MSAQGRLYMLDQATDEQFRVGCATPGLHCQEFPLFAPTLDEARALAKKHAEDHQHVSSIKWVRTTSVEVWSADEEAALRATSQRRDDLEPASSGSQRSSTESATAEEPNA